MLPLNSRDSPLFHTLLSIQKSPAILFQPIIKMPYMTSLVKGGEVPTMQLVQKYMGKILKKLTKKPYGKSVPNIHKIHSKLQSIMQDI